MKIFEKVANLCGKLNGLLLVAVALGIVFVVFVIGLVLSLGGDLGKFKKMAKMAIASPTAGNFQVTAKQMPVKVRKQYKKVKQTGEKPSDGITIDTCVYAPYQASAASHFPGMVMAAGILSILLSFFASGYVKSAKMINTDTMQSYYMLIPVFVTAGVMVLRLLAGLISSAILAGGVKTYEKYVAALDKCLYTGNTQEIPATTEMPAQNMSAAEQNQQDIPFGSSEETTKTYEDTFDSPTRISVELAPDEPQPVTEAVQDVPVQPEPVVTPQESEAEFRARARAEAMAHARAEQAQRAAQAQAVTQATQTQATQTTGGSADAVIARIRKITQEGASLAEMKEVALQLQKERAKPENKTPEQQRKLNEALAALLKAMSSANRK